MQTSTPDQIRSAVREVYGAVATRKSGAGCCGSSTGCCGTGDLGSTRLGYTDDDVNAVPEGANLGLGCGNPQAIASLRAGERVLDLGSGGGFDAFLAARQVGRTGHVIGVDMTPEMIALSRRHIETSGLSQVEFRLGEIEQLPVADSSVDVILSNCVINLSPDKPAVFREAFRVLAPGGRLAISDMVAMGDIPAALAADPAAYAGCVAGATPVCDIQQELHAAGFVDVGITVEGSRELVESWSPDTGASQVVASALIQAVKPGGSGAYHGDEASAVQTAPFTADLSMAPEPCCDTVLLSTCCEEPAKSECCGTSAGPGTCGCQAAAANDAW